MNNVSTVLVCLTFCSHEIDLQITRVIYNRRARTRIHSHLKYVPRDIDIF